MFKVSNRSTRCCSSVFVINFEYIWHVSNFFFFFFFALLTLNMQIPDRTFCCLNLNSSVCFRVGSRSPVTFQTKLCYILQSTAVSSYYLFFATKLHLRCCTGLELSMIVTRVKISLFCLSCHVWCWCKSHCSSPIATKRFGCAVTTLFCPAFAGSYPHFI